ncbi:hypothetical protein XENORESO_004835 [Xenotaenia resolanae]|uniref:Uncharacterized protein n=1 Tax=Xenotaenia resolanae TaxID=208358 RepID=A0ABV0WPR0_9TELE
MIFILQNSAEKQQRLKEVSGLHPRQKLLQATSVADRKTTWTLACHQKAPPAASPTGAAAFLRLGQDKHNHQSKHHFLCNKMFVFQG